MHLREIFYGNLIFQQSSMICLDRHVGGHTLALQHSGRNLLLAYTVKPLLSGPPIKWTPSIKQTLSQVPRSTSYISLYNEPLFSRHLY